MVHGYLKYFQDTQQIVSIQELLSIEPLSSVSIFKGIFEIPS